MKRLDTMVVLMARIEARAELWKRGNYENLPEMMWPLYAYAKRMDLFDKLGGIEGIDKLMLEALENEKQAG